MVIITVRMTSGRAMPSMVRKVRRLFRNALLVTKVVRVMLRLQKTKGETPRTTLNSDRRQLRTAPCATPVTLPLRIDDAGQCHNQPRLALIISIRSNHLKGFIEQYRLCNELDDERSVEQARILCQWTLSPDPDDKCHDLPVGK